MTCSIEATPFVVLTSCEGKRFAGKPISSQRFMRTQWSWEAVIQAAIRAQMPCCLPQRVIVIRRKIQREFQASIHRIQGGKAALESLNWTSCFAPNHSAIQFHCELPDAIGPSANEVGQMQPAILRPLLLLLLP